MSLPRHAGLCSTILALAVAAACAAPPPTPAPDTATPTPTVPGQAGVQTAFALLTASFASLTPTPSEIPSVTPQPSQTLRVLTSTPSQTLGILETPSVLSATPSQTLRVSETLRASTATPTPRFTATRSTLATVTLTPAATMTPTAAPRIVPTNSVSLTLAAVLGPIVITGTQVVKLDQAAWAPDGQLAASGAGGVLFAQGGVLTATRGYTMGVWTPSLSFSTDGLDLALGSVGGTVRLFKRADGALLFQLVQPNLRVSQVRYRPGPPGVLAQYLASLGGDNTIYMWDVAYKKFLGTLEPGPSNAQALEFSGDGRWLAGASGNVVLVWDMSALPPAGWTTPLAPTLTLTQDGAVTGLALSRDGFWLAAANANGYIGVWALRDGQMVTRLAQLGAPAEHLAFSPDGEVLASAHTDMRIRLWGWTLVSQNNDPAVTLAGHTALITSLAFSPDGRTLASSSWDGTVRLWAVR